MKTEFLKSFVVPLTNKLNFTDRQLPVTNCNFTEHSQFTKLYFVNLHNAVKSCGTNNYRGARIPLAHNNINVDKFRDLLTKFGYPHIHILQFIQYGFPLGLWSDAFLEPSTKNHSSAYSYFTYVDKFIESELNSLVSQVLLKLRHGTLLWCRQL